MDLVQDVESTWNLFVACTEQAELRQVGLVAQSIERAREHIVVWHREDGCADKVSIELLQSLAGAGPENEKRRDQAGA